MKHRKILIIGYLAIVLSLLSVGCLEIIGYQIQDSANQPIGEIYGSKVVGQSFTMIGSKLTRVDVKLATYNRTNTKDVFFQVREENVSESIVNITVNGEKIQDNAYYSFEFNPIPVSKGKRYIFTISSPNSTPGNAITIWYNTHDVYAGGTALVNGSPIEGDLSFKTYSLLDLPVYFFQEFTRDIGFFIFYILLLIGIVSGIIWLQVRER